VWQVASLVNPIIRAASSPARCHAVNILHAEMQTLHQAQAGTIYQAGHDPVDTLQDVLERFDRWSRQHGW
jgi:hypothetical protein